MRIYDAYKTWIFFCKVCLEIEPIVYLVIFMRKTPLRKLYKHFPNTYLKNYIKLLGIINGELNLALHHSKNFEIDKFEDS